MKTFVFFFWLIYDFFCTCNGELKFLQTIFRHGDRVRDGIKSVGLNFYPNDPYSMNLWYPNPEGHLTEVGKNRSYQLGLFYRAKYGSWLNQDNNPSVVQFISSPLNRTRMTAKLVLAGLFRHNRRLKLRNNYKWQPTVISWTEDINNYLFFSSFMCQNYHEAMERALETEQDLVSYINESKEFYKFLGHHTGFNGTARTAMLLYSTLKIEMEKGLKMPGWTKNIFPEGELKKAAIMEYIIPSFNDELKSLNGGMWLKTWFDNIDNFIAGKTLRKKAYFYSGHDTNICAILIALGIFDPHLPPFNSVIIFELHEEDKEFFVKVIYRQFTNSTEYIVPGCPSVMCPLEILKKNLENILPEDPKTACGKINIK